MSSKQAEKVRWLQRTIGNTAMSALATRGSDAAPVQREAEEEEEEEAVQRQAEDEEQEEEQKQVQSSRVGAAATPQVDESVGSQLHAASSGGSALAPDVQRTLEAGLGADLSNVRVHTDAEADHLSRSVDAVAFTTGQNIFFRTGAYDPSSSQGMHLLAHEATHTVQQSAGPVDGTPAGGGVSISDPGDRYERAAESAATEMSTNSSGPVQRAIQRGTSPSVAPWPVQRNKIPVQRNPEDDLREALRKRRGMVAGMSEEDVAKEHAVEDFVGSRGKRETAEASGLTGTITDAGKLAAASATGLKQEEGPGGLGRLLLANTRKVAEQKEAETVEGDPMVDRIKLAGLVSTRGKLGEQGFDTLLNEKQQREASMKWSDVTAATPQLDEQSAARQGLNQAVTDYGEGNALARSQHKALDQMLQKAEQAAALAATKATWDDAQIKSLGATARTALTAVIDPPVKVPDEVAPRVTTAQAAIGALNVRATQDMEWMESLKPYTEDTIKDGLKRMASDDKTVMNNNMSITWNSIVTKGSQVTRDEAEILAKVNSLAGEIDRKTPFDPELAKSRMAGSPKDKNAVMIELQARTTAKRSISAIIKEEANAATLAKFVKKFRSLDNFDFILSRTPDRTQLGAIAEKANSDLPALRRIYQAADAKPAKVHFWLCGEGGQKIGFLDDWFQKNGEVWDGATCAAPTLLPAGKTKEQIEAVAVPKEGGSGPAPGGYAGNRVFGSNTRPPDMLLPQHATDSAAITYKEYDTKPYQPGVNRGADRFVKGSDGRYYYTNDHYHTFRKFA